jgi:HEAT repeat protein
MGRGARRKHEAALEYVAPRWRDRHRREQQRRRERGEMSADELALLEALEAAGVRTEDFGLLASATVETTFDYGRAVPVLVEWLPKVRDPVLKEIVIRSLAGRKEAKSEGGRALVEEFRRLPPSDEWSSVKWAIGDALATLADASVADDLLELVRDQSHGKARERLCDALVRTKDPRAPKTLIEALDDPDLAGHAISALRGLGPKSSLPHLERARPKLERLVEDSGATPLARKQAGAALERLEA